MSTNLQSSARRCTPDVRTKWISSKFWDFLPWQNSMQVSCNAIKVLTVNVLDLQKKLTRHGWWRFDAITFLIHSWLVSWSKLTWFGNKWKCILQMLGKSRSQFIKEYNQRLFNWLVVFSLIMVVIGRFVVKFILIEIGAWILFIFLETYTKMFWSIESLYYNSAWQFVVATWEILVYNPILDLDRWAIPVGVMLSVFMIYWWSYGRKYGSQWLLPLYRSNKNRPRTD